MMASRNPRVKPVTKSVRKKPAAKKEQARAWEDDKKEEIEMRESDKEPLVESSIGGSTISVKEAENPIDTTEDEWVNNNLEGETSFSQNGTSETDNGTEKGITNGALEMESDSLASIDSELRRQRIKRNTVVPGEEPVSGRGTPDSRVRKDAWDVAQDADNESESTSSRPSSVPNMKRSQEEERPTSAKDKISKLYRPLSSKGKAQSGAETYTTGVTSAESSQGLEMSELSSEKTAEVYENPQATEMAVVPFNKETSMVRSSEDSQSITTVSSSNLLAPPKLAGEQNAYIPFLYAKDSIQKVMEDMKKMKASHLKIVDQVQEQYKLIENDTQDQFQTFVINMRSEYAGKVSTFRHVIEVHRKDLQNKETYWLETIKSLQAKNKILLQEKRDVMMKDREEILNIENEKVTAVRDLTRMLDEKHAKQLLILGSLDTEKTKNKELEERIKELEARLAALGEDKDSNIAAYEEEIKKLKLKHEEEMTELKQKLDQVEKEKEEEKTQADEDIRKLQAHIEELEKQIASVQKQTGAVVVPVAAPVIRRTSVAQKPEAAPVTQTVTVTQETVLAPTEQTTLVTREATVTKEVVVVRKDEEGKEVKVEVKEEPKETPVTVEAGAPVVVAPVAVTPVAVTGEAPTEIIKTVTVTQEVYMDAEEKKRLLADIEKYKNELAKSQEELEKNAEEIEATKKEIEEANQKILNAEESISLLSKEKARFEKNATESKKELHVSRQQVESLRAQLQALLATAVVQKDDSESEEKLKAAEEEKAALMAEQAKFKAEVERLQEEAKKKSEEAEAKVEEGEPPPPVEDRSDEIQALMDKLKEEERKLQEKENAIAVMTMLKEGVVPETVTVVGEVTTGGTERLEELEERNASLEVAIDKLEVEVERLNKEKEVAEDKNAELTEKNADLKENKSDLEEKVKDLEERVSELNETIEDVTKDLEEAKNIMPVGVVAPVQEGASAEELEEMSNKVQELQEELERAFKELESERGKSSANMEEVNLLKLELSSIKDGREGEMGEIQAQLAATQGQLQAELDSKQKALEEAKKRIAELEKQLLENVPVDTAKELQKYKNKIEKLEAEKEETVKLSATLQASVSSLKVKIDNLNKKVETHKKNEKELVESQRVFKEEKEKQIANLQRRLELATKTKKEDPASKKKIEELQKRIKELEAQLPKAGSKIDTTAPKRDLKMEARLEEKYGKEVDKLKSQVDALKKASKEDSAKMRQMEKDLKEAKDKADKKPAVSAEDRQAMKKLEKQLKDLQKKYDMDSKRLENTKEKLQTTEEELAALKKEYEALEAESKRDKHELSKLGIAAKEGLEAAMKVEDLSKEVKKLHDENKTLTDNFNSERILRKKYYNMVEDMKGKIRVYCRARPMSKSELERGNHSVIKSPDEYTIVVASNRGNKDFQYDQVFMPESTQEKVFEDTNNLIQSSVDGYNVCIFAYGQTGSGKTFTMIGDKEGAFPGIAPRAMSRIFEVMDENKKKFSFKVSCYMLELYNDKLLDLLSGSHKHDDQKLEIKKDKKGLVFVHGAVVEHAKNREELWAIFERGSENRHVASTKMNAESSRSHLVLSIIIESTNLTTGAVVKGKLSLVDLAGSERAAKTEASAEQLKEAQSINKSLSALGDVISALSSEQQFIPYRNNKLTMLMQDSLGGNAKTLMFVNISPADYNTDETVTSLTYASRVKLITNDAQKNSDNKEIARLKGIIAKLKKGENVDEED